MLELYKNIKKRRTELNLTQGELAARLGYADKSMISRIEKGEIDLPQSKIYAFANVLRIDYKELMGFDNENLNPKERELLELFNLMNDEGQAVALSVLKGLAPQYTVKESK